MMKLCVFVLASVALVQGTQLASPVTKVLQMLSDLHAKITEEGKAAQKVFDEFSEWCEHRSKTIAFEIKTGKNEAADLTAAIEKERATITSLDTKIDELAGEISGDDGDLQAATKIRNKESDDFKSQEKELVEVIGMLEKAISILEREMKKGGSASMMQLQGAKSMADALGVMVEASVISSADSKKLAALVQSSQDAQDELGAPAGAVYEGHSGGIIGTMQDLYEKAEAQLAKARKAESTSLGNYNTLKQSLEDEIVFAKRDMMVAKKNKAHAEEGKASAEGDLAVTEKDLDEDTTTLATVRQDCQTGADDFESEKKSRNEELKALKTAEEVIEENARGVGSAEEQAYSFVQVVSHSQSSLSTSVDLVNFEAVRYVRDLARQVNSPALAQLAKRMASAVRSGSADPFSKIKRLINDMIERLEKEAQADASQKAFCDSQTADATAKKEAKQALMDKLSTDIDSDSAKAAKLKEQLATLHQELAQLASSQAEMDKIRSDEKAIYDANSAEMKKGIEAVKYALQVLRKYYASDDATAHDGAGAGIMGMLEVVESDFVKGLAEMSASESAATADYDKTTKQNVITRHSKGLDVKYKQKMMSGLNKDISEAKQDDQSAQAELDAINKFLAALDSKCVAKPETKAETIARREKEIAGLKEALNILEGEAVLIQQQSSKRTLRGKH